MEYGRLVFNKYNGHYGIKYSNTETWVTDKLNNGDSISMYDYTVDHWISEQIISSPPGNTQESWSLKVTGRKGIELHNVLVKTDE